MIKKYHFNAVVLNINTAVILMLYSTLLQLKQIINQILLMLLSEWYLNKEHNSHVNMLH